MGKLNLDIKIGDTLHIGETKVQLLEKSGRLARLSIEADNHIEIKHKRMSASDSVTETQAHGKYIIRLLQTTLLGSTDQLDDRHN